MAHVKTFFAAYPGECNNFECLSVIDAGDLISWDPEADGVVCETCTRDRLDREDDEETNIVTTAYNPDALAAALANLTGETPAPKYSEPATPLAAGYSVRLADDWTPAADPGPVPAPVGADDYTEEPAPFTEAEVFEMAEAKPAPFSAQIFAKVTETVMDPRNPIEKAAGIPNPYAVTEAGQRQLDMVAQLSEETRNRIAASMDATASDLLGVPREHVATFEVPAEAAPAIGRQVPGQLSIEENIRINGAGAVPQADLDRQARRSELVGPFPEEPAPVEEAPFDTDTKAYDLSEYRDRLEAYLAAKARQAAADKASREAKAEAEEIFPELMALVPEITQDPEKDPGAGKAVVLVDGKPFAERVDTVVVDVDVKAWQARNPKWKDGRYARKSTRTAFRPVKD